MMKCSSNKSSGANSRLHGSLDALCLMPARIVCYELNRRFSVNNFTVAFNFATQHLCNLCRHDMECGEYDLPTFVAKLQSATVTLNRYTTRLGVKEWRRGMKYANHNLCNEKLIMLEKWEWGWGVRRGIC